VNQLERLDLARYGRWLQRMAGDGVVCAICGGDGRLLWSADQTQAALEAVLGELRARPDALGPSLPTGAVCRLADGRCVVKQTVQPADGSVPGAVLAVLDEGHDDAATLRLDAVIEVLEDIARAMRDECNAGSELDTMAQELAERYDELHLVYAVDHELRHRGDGDRIFRRLLDVCAAHLDLDVVALLRHQPDTLYSATRPSAPIHNLDLVLTEMRGDLLRFVISSRQSLVMNEATDSRRKYIFSDMPYRILAAPVLREDRVIGLVVMLNHLAKPEFRNSDRKLAEMMASQFSSMFQMYDLFDELSTFNEQMAAALIESVEAKDPYTRGHSERVHFLSMEIGRAMELSDEELDALYWGSLLHDVGKIGIPDAVLCKPGRLTEDEMTFIKVHPERSYEILRHIDRLKEAVPGARHHQEKFDGTGYPHGLKGKRIPLNARIIATADTYDSITSSRAYRAGLPHEFALREMRRVAGSQLDPEVFEVFLGLCAAEPEWLQRFHIKREPEPQPTGAG